MSSKRTATLEQLEASTTLRLAQVASGVLYCLVSSGIIFGYAALKIIFISEGVYKNLCTPDEIDAGVRVCLQQELRLNLMFNLAAVVTNVAALPVGFALDRYGPRVVSLVGCCFLVLGPCLLAFAQSIPPDKFDAFIPGFLLLALGGPCIYISTFQLSNAFPLNSGLVLSALTGAFDSSSAVFLGYRLLYQATGDALGNGGVRLSTFFTCYCIVPVIIAILQLTIMPKQSYKTMSELVNVMEDEPMIGEGDYEAVEDEEVDDIGPLPSPPVPVVPGPPIDHPEHTDSSAHVHIAEDTEQTALLRAGRRTSSMGDFDVRRRRRSSAVSQISAFIGEEATESAAKKEEKKRAISGVWGALHGQTAGQQIRTLWFLFVVLFTGIQMLRTNYFIATVRPQYEYLLESWELSVRLNVFFDMALPLGGLAAIPFIGVLLDNASMVLTLCVLMFVGAVIGILGIIPRSLPAGYANILLFVAYRPFFYTSISDYCAKVFGFETFGTVYGLVVCCSGAFNLVQAALDRTTVQVFDGNPIPVNTALLVTALILGTAFVTFVASQVKRLKSERTKGLSVEQADAEELILPDPPYTVRI